MKLLLILFAVLAVIAMVSANHNPMCNDNDAAQSSDGYNVYEMSGRAAAARAAAPGSAVAAASASSSPRAYHNYGSSRNIYKNA